MFPVEQMDEQQRRAWERMSPQVRRWYAKRPEATLRAQLSAMGAFLQQSDNMTPEELAVHLRECEALTPKAPFVGGSNLLLNESHSCTPRSPSMAQTMTAPLGRLLRWLLEADRAVGEWQSAHEGQPDAR